MAGERERSIVVMTVGAVNLDPSTQGEEPMNSRRVGRKVVVAGILTMMALGFGSTVAGASRNDPCANARHWSDYTAGRLQDAMTFEEWDYWYNVWEINEGYMDDLGC